MGGEIVVGSFLSDEILLESSCVELVPERTQTLRHKWFALSDASSESNNDGNDEIFCPYSLNLISSMYIFLFYCNGGQKLRKRRFSSNIRSVEKQGRLTRSGTIRSSAHNFATRSNKGRQETLKDTDDLFL